ncbi:hypothetical protein E4K10_44875 [Streptomyces sp. T1317-0309]|nr:hypothetical protein E4K10_44875 [Streptomyces sp. T1317-0309]
MPRTHGRRSSASPPSPSGAGGALPLPATIGRVLRAVDGDALDRAVGAYLAEGHRAAAEPGVPVRSASARRRVIAREDRLGGADAVPGEG